MAFESTAPGLIAGDTNDKMDVFVRDAREKTTERVSAGRNGAQANGDSYDASISDDGRYVAFTSTASNLVSGDTNGVADVFVYDRTEAAVERVSVSEAAAQLSLGGEGPDLSGNGRYVAYVTRSQATPSRMSCLNSSDNQAADVYLYDRSLKKTVTQVSAETWTDWASQCSDGTEEYTVEPESFSVNPSISADGSYVAFESHAAFYHGRADTNGVRDVYVRAATGGVPERVSISDKNTEGNQDSFDASISGDGRYVAFASRASNLDLEHDCCAGVRDTNGYSDIHVRDRLQGRTTWASRRPLAATQGASYAPSLSGGGTQVSFASDAALQTTGINADTNGVRDVYSVRHGSNATPIPMSFDNEQGLGNRGSDLPAESGDGKCTAFSSAASNFLPSFMGDNDGFVDVYRHCFKADVDDHSCYVDRISEPPSDRRDGPGFYGYDAEEVRPGRVELCAGDPVNCATGNFFEEQVDFAIGGRGVGLDLSRTYNAQDAASASAAAGRFGYGWSFSFGERLSIDAGAGAVSVHHRDGQVARFTRRSDGSYAPERLVQSSLRRNADGSFTYTLPDQRTFVFDAAGRLSSKADRNDNRTTLAYDGAGRLGSITDPTGRKLTLAYNSDGTVSQVSDPAGRTVRYGYDAAKNLTEVTDVGGKLWQFGYDAKHRMTTFTDPRSAKTTNVYDARDRVTSQTDPLGRETQWAYDGDKTQVTDPRGSVTETHFRSHLPVLILGAATGPPSARALTRLRYDAEANVVKVIDANGHGWNYGYDAQGNRTSATDPLGHTTAHAYDAKRNPTALTLPSGRVTRYGYDARSNLVSTERTLAETGQTQTTTRGYDGLGQLTSVTDPLGRSWRYAHNAQGDPTSATSPAGRKTTASYDGQGWLVSTVSGRGNAPGANPAAYTTSYTRDAYGRATAVRDPLGHSSTMAYDGAGNVTDMTDRDGRRTQSAYDLAGQATQVTRGDGSALRTGYDANGQVTSQTDGLGRKTSYGRDPLGRVTSTTDPLGRKTSYDYDRAGRRTGLTDPVGRVTAYDYDDADRLTSIGYSSGAPKPISYGYDVDSQLRTMTDQSGRSTMGYDSLGRLVDSTNGGGQTLRYGYDLADQVTSLVYPEALTALDTATGAGLDPVATGTVTRGYDEDGHLTSVEDWLGNTTGFGYDQDGNLARTARPDGSVSTLTRDPNGMVTDLNDLGGSGPVLRAGSPRTDEGLLASTSESGAAAGPGERFGYDGAARLTGAGPDATKGYGYDAADNPTGLPSPDGPVAQSFDAANQLTETTRASDGSPVSAFIYDRDGNRTSTTAAGGARANYGYDQADQLTSYTGPDRSRPGQSVTATYSYDATGVRQAKTVNGSERTQTWDRSGSLPVLIADGPTAYITGPDGRPIEQILQDGTVRYFHHDAHGSTRALTNQSGNVVASYSYDAYGNPTSPPTGVENAFGYDGQQTDPETGLQYLRARYYDPTTAQFLTRDPITDQTRAPYTYANDNPTNYNDPTGLSPAGDFLDGVVDGTLDVLEPAGETAVGALDTPTFGLTTKGLDAIGIHVNECSRFYSTGGWIPVGGPLSLLGKSAKVAKLGRGTKGGGAPGGTPSPALKGSPYDPREVDRRRSELRRRLRTGNRDPDSPIPDQRPGENLGRLAQPDSSHRTGERNVNPDEEHSRRAKGVPRYGR